MALSLSNYNEGYVRANDRQTKHNEIKRTRRVAQKDWE
jgi:hypothetical protein